MARALYYYIIFFVVIPIAPVVGTNEKKNYNQYLTDHNI